VLSNHDVVRHATRYGLPPLGPEHRGRGAEKHGAAWLAQGAPESQLDREAGERRARAASMFLLALPGSAYVYQGEELGLHEVATIPDAQRQDPTFFRTEGEEIGRDGCRVPLPWTVDGPSFGFGADGAHLPQPEWFGSYAVEREESDPDSTLELYRRALSLRHRLQTEERLEWIDTGRDDVLRFRRPNGWEVVTNFGTEPYPLERAGEVVLSSRGDASAAVAGESTVWLHPSA
jgi:alpha-glucosidase